MRLPPRWEGQFDIRQLKTCDDDQWKVYGIKSNSADVLSGVTFVVCCGGMDAPRELMGASHLLEHITFCGSIDYPEDNYISQVCESVGGSINACTTNTETSYYFTVTLEKLELALDVLADAFFNPLLLEKSIAKEIDAIDYEFEGEKYTYEGQIVQLLKKLANVDHPWYDSFNCGNKETLSALPAEQVAKTLRELHSKLYMSRQKYLVVAADTSIEDIAGMVSRTFGKRFRQSAPPSPRPSPCVAYGPNELPKTLLVAPELVTPIDKLEFRFVFSDSIDVTRFKPLAYLTYILNQEGDNSLRSTLVSQGLIKTLTAGRGHQGFGQAFYDIEMVCTPKGISRHGIGKIGETLFAFWRMIKEEGISHQIWKEMRHLQELSFNFSDVPNTSSLSRMVASSLIHGYPDEELVSGPSLSHGYNAKLISDILNQLNSSNLALIIYSDTIAQALNIPNTRDPYYKTKYSIRPVRKEWRDLWAAPRLSTAFMRLPSLNRLIPRRLSITRRDSLFDGDFTTPRIVEDEALPSNVVIHFHQSAEQETPHAAISCRFYLKSLIYTRKEVGQYYRCGSIVAKTKGDSLETSGPITRGLVAIIIVNAINQRLRKLGQQANMAGLYGSIRVTSAAGDGQVALELEISGFSDKAEELGEAMFNELLANGLSNESLQESISELTEQLRRKIVNTASSSLNKNTLSMLFLPTVTTAQQELSILETLTPSDVRAFFNNEQKATHQSLVGRLFDNCLIVVVAGGNLNKDRIKHWMDRVIFGTFRKHHVNFHEGDSDRGDIVQAWGETQAPSLDVTAAGRVLDRTPEAMVGGEFSLIIDSGRPPTNDALAFVYLCFQTPDTQVNVASTYQTTAPESTPVTTPPVPKENVKTQVLKEGSYTLEIPVAIEAEDDTSVVDLTTSDSESNVMVTIPVGRDLDANECAKLCIARSILETRFYSFLRDKHQLAYYLGTSFVSLAAVQGITFSVTAPRPFLILQKMSEFLNDPETWKVEPEAFENKRSTFVAFFKSDQETLDERHDDIKSMVFQGKQDWNAKERLVACLELLTVEEQNAYQRRILSEGVWLISIITSDLRVPRIDEPIHPTYFKGGNYFPLFPISQIDPECKYRRKWIQMRDPRSLHKFMVNGIIERTVGPGVYQR